MDAMFSAIPIRSTMQTASGSYTPNYITLLPQRHRLNLFFPHMIHTTFIDFLNGDG